MPPFEHMKNNTLLTITSLLTILLSTLHITDDIVRGLESPSPANAFVILIFVVWLVGTLLLAERRSGYVIALLGSLLAASMPVLHMRGAHYGLIAKSSGGFFFVWTLIAVGITATFSVILAARALGLLRSGRPRSE